MPSPLSLPQKDPRPSFEMPLWTEMARPTMRLVFPPVTTPNVPALVIFRGGAYGTSQGSGEGTAEWAAKHGMLGVEVGYRTQGTGDPYPHNYADAARAMRLIRGHWTALGVDPYRIGVMGYSAGGHLATTLSTRPELYTDPEDGLAQDVSARPDFVVLGYPLISFVADYQPGSFANSVENFFGRKDVDTIIRRQFSNELHVIHGHPPTFIWTTADDALVPASQSRLFVDACQKANVDITYKEYPSGRHGLGLALDAEGEVKNWTGELVNWMAAHGIYSPPQ